MSLLSDITDEVLAAFERGEDVLYMPEREFGQEATEELTEWVVAAYRARGVSPASASGQISGFVVGLALGSRLWRKKDE